MSDDWEVIKTNDIAAPYILKKTKPEPTKKEKDWNLKGKEIDTWRSGKKRGRHWNTYHENVIGALREKLISDIDNILVEFASYFGEEYYNLEDKYRTKAEQIINSRFGVDKDE